MAKTFSGKKVVKVLTREFGFSFISQRGSHVKLRRFIDGKKVTTIVPMYRELPRGTLRGVLDLAKVDEREFRKVAK